MKIKEKTSSFISVRSQPDNNIITITDIKTIERKIFFNKMLFPVFFLSFHWIPDQFRHDGL